MDILCGKRKDAEMNDLISIGTCGLHTIHPAFQHGEGASKWHITKPLAAMFKIFHECPSKKADFENVTSCDENNSPLQFCAHRWIENEVVTRRAQVVWPRLVEVVIYWQSLPKSKQQGQDKPDGNKSYQSLANSCSNALILLRLAFFEEIAKKLNKFLRGFQIDSLMVSFLVDTIEEIVRDFCGRFILSDVMSKVVKTVDLIIISMLDNTIHKPNVDLGFPLRCDIGVLKKKKKKRSLTNY